MMRACVRFCLLGAFAAMLKVAFGFDYPLDRGGSFGGLQRIEVLRVTSHSIIVKVFCEASCPEDIRWETKTYADILWQERTSKDVLRAHKNVYQLLGLVPNRYYEVRGTWDGSSTRAFARTCFAGPPFGASHLRVGRSGPGWLDIRWKIPYRECRGDFEYRVRYMPVGGNWTSPRVYGAYFIADKDALHVGPSHPCPRWPKEFCVMLTDNVVTGSNHIVEVTVMRLNGSEEEVSRPATVEAYADPHNTQGYEDVGIPAECVPWAWLAMGAALFDIVVVVTMLVSSVVHTVRKANAYEREHGPPEGPFDIMEMLYH